MGSTDFPRIRNLMRSLVRASDESVDVVAYPTRPVVRPSGARGDAPLALGRLSGRPVPHPRRALYAPPDGVAGSSFPLFGVSFRRHA